MISFKEELEEDEERHLVIFPSSSNLLYSRMLALFSFSLLLFLLGGSNNKDKVLLEKVTAITLEEGRMTNARRSSAIPQVSQPASMSTPLSYLIIVAVRGRFGRLL